METQMNVPQRNRMTVPALGEAAKDLRVLPYVHLRCICVHPRSGTRTL